jgi:hypothetical protein
MSDPRNVQVSQDLNNLLVAGKAMAQTFIANEATRMHPVEYASGVAAGVAASMLAAGDASTTAELVTMCLGSQYCELQERISKGFSPLEWSSLRR